MTEGRTFLDFVDIKYKNYPPAEDDPVEYAHKIYEIAINRSKDGTEMVARRIDTERRDKQ